MSSLPQVKERRHVPYYDRHVDWWLEATQGKLEQTARLRYDGRIRSETPFTVLLDVDGVLANFTELMMRSANAIYGTNDPWDMAGPNDDVLRNSSANETRVREWMRRHASAADMEALISRDSAQYLATLELREPPIQLRFVTTSFRSPGWEQDRVAWLAQLFRKSTDWVYERIIFTDDKSLVMGDLLVEDNVKNASLWLARNTDGVVVMFPRSTVLNNDAARHDAWVDVFRAIQHEVGKWT